MSYTSMTFLYFFLPVFLGIYFLAKPRLRAALLALGSCAVIASAEPAGLIPLATCLMTAYLCGLGIGKLRESSKAASAFLLMLCILAEGSGAVLFCTLQGSQIKLFTAVGAGIYTLHSAAYCFEVRRGTIDAVKDPIRLLAYIAFLPSLNGIPLADPKKLLPELKAPVMEISKVSDGILMMLLGITEKVVISDRLSLLFYDMQESSSGSISLLMSWLGAFIFAAALFCRLKGYARIAVGFSLMLGFELPASFDHPYSKATLRDYLGSFNISAYRFVQSYVFGPIAGNESSQFRTLSASAISIIVLCISYRPSVVFLIWGVSAALLIIIEMLLDHRLAHIPSPIRYIITHMLTLIGWAFVSQSSTELSLEYVSHMFTGAMLLDSAPLLYFLKTAIPSVVLLAVIESPLTGSLIKRIKEKNITALLIIKPILTFALLIVCTVFLLSSEGGAALLGEGGMI
ncbi:MAG: hypothetical protein IJ561_00780 [Ruminococcus sp.]|nr:hypothetical protein [Ruminococcus sp.]